MIPQESYRRIEAKVEEYYRAVKGLEKVVELETIKRLEGITGRHENIYEQHHVVEGTSYIISPAGKESCPAQNDYVLGFLGILGIPAAIAGAGGGVVGYAHILAYLFENGSHSDSPIGMTVLLLAGFCGAPFLAIAAGALGGALGLYLTVGLAVGLVEAGVHVAGRLRGKIYVHNPA